MKQSYIYITVYVHCNSMLLSEQYRRHGKLNMTKAYKHVECLNGKTPMQRVMKRSLRYRRRQIYQLVMFQR